MRHPCRLAPSLQTCAIPELAAGSISRAARESREAPRESGMGGGGRRESRGTAVSQETPLEKWRKEGGAARLRARRGWRRRSRMRATVIFLLHPRRLAPFLRHPRRCLPFTLEAPPPPADFSQIHCGCDRRYSPHHRRAMAAREFRFSFPGVAIRSLLSSTWTASVITLFPYPCFHSFGDTLFLCGGASFKIFHSCISVRLRHQLS